MNILYCGDAHMEDGLLISILSLLKVTREPVCVYILTMSLTVGDRHFEAVGDDCAARLDAIVKESCSQGFVKKLDLTELFAKDRPEANMNTRFTPFCMLRLFADLIDELPGRLLYLDMDVVCRRDPASYYHQPMDGYELAGTPDYYGRWFFRNNLLRMDYLNSGVLLLNMDRIRETGLFMKCRARCRTQRMFMPDQSAINKLAKSKKLMPRRYNEQRKLHQDTVLQHFTTSFRFFPWVHTVSVKPWQVDQVHEKLKIHAYDDILNEYLEIKARM